jgi:hypothetical protein
MNEIVPIKRTKAANPIRLTELITAIDNDPMSQAAQRITGDLDRCCWLFRVCGDYHTEERRHALVRILKDLSKAIPKAEEMLGKPQYQAMATQVETVIAPATLNQIKAEIGVLLGCFPSAGCEVEVLATVAVEDIADEKPTLIRLVAGFRHLRRTAKFRPTIAEMLGGLGEGYAIEARARRFKELLPWLKRAKAIVPSVIERANVEIEELEAGLESQRELNRPTDYLNREKHAIQEGLVMIERSSNC